MSRTTRLALVVVSSLFIAVLVVHGSIPTVATGQWGAGADLRAARSGAASVLLPDGRVLLAGGSDSGGAPLASVELVNTDGSVSAAAPMNVARTSAAALMLPNGDVLVTGGGTTDGGITNSAEVYDPLFNSWEILTSTMVSPRSGHSASLLLDGTVLLAGGNSSSGPVSALETYDEISGSFSQAGVLATGRMEHAAAVLPDGRVFIAGGTDANGATLASTEIYDPRAGTVSPGPALNTARARHTATTLLEGTVLIAGGSTPATPPATGMADLASAEIFDPANTSATSTTTISSSLATGRSGHLAFLLPNNHNVLIAGGTAAGSALASAEMYTPWTQQFAATGGMSTARASASGAPFSVDGLLIVMGGQDPSGATLAGTDFYRFATVKTDQQDYPPGATVNMSGGGWQPGETVTLTLVESPNIDSHGPYTATADANGQFSNSSFTTDINDFGVRFYLTAVGNQSGWQAQNTFTDALGLSFTTDPFTALVGQCSPMITIKVTGAAGPTSSNTINLTSSSTGANGGKFYSNSSCSTQITTVTILGNNSGNFYYKDNTAGTPTITISATGATSRTQQETINRFQLAFATAAFTKVVGQCSDAVTVQTRDANGNAATVGSNTTVSLATDSGAGNKFYSDGACTSPITSVTIATGSNSANFFYKDSVDGTPTITASGTQLASASQVEAIDLQLAFTTSPFTVNTGQCSPVISVQSQNFAGTLTAPTNNRQVTLGTDSGTGTFYSDAACTTAVTFRTLPANGGNAGTISFYYKDSAAGSPTITVSGTLLVSASQVETVNLPDGIAPTSSATLSPTNPNGNNGWYVSNVHVTISATDNTGGSGVADTRCVLDPASAPASFDSMTDACAYLSAGADVTTDGQHTIYFASSDHAGNKESVQSVSFKIDQTPPYYGAPARASGSEANSNGWNNTSVTVNFPCSDATSGSATNPVVKTITTEGTNQTATALASECVDQAGNQAAAGASLSGINIDKTKPTITAGVPASGAGYILGQSLTSSFTCNDDRSGFLPGGALSTSGPNGTDCTGPSSVDTSTVGSKTYGPLNATDRAGNAADLVNVTYNVIYNFIGFFSPVDNPPIWNVGKAGRTFPEKWQLTDASGAYIRDLSTVTSIKYIQVQCPNGQALTSILDGVADTSGSSGLRYDLTNEQFVFTWQTAKGWAGICVQLNVSLNDGTTHSALFQFTR